MECSSRMSRCHLLRWTLQRMITRVIVLQWAEPWLSRVLPLDPEGWEMRGEVEGKGWARGRKGGGDGKGDSLREVVGGRGWRGRRWWGKGDSLREVVGGRGWGGRRWWGKGDSLREVVGGRGWRGRRWWGKGDSLEEEDGEGKGVGGRGWGQWGDAWFRSSLSFLVPQDSYLGDDFNLKSQADAVLSQDSTYQGDRGGFMNSLPDYASQPNYASQYWCCSPRGGGRRGWGARDRAPAVLSWQRPRPARASPRQPHRGCVSRKVCFQAVSWHLKRTTFCKQARNTERNWRLKRQPCFPKQ